MIKNFRINIIFRILLIIIICYLTVHTFYAKAYMATTVLLFLLILQSFNLIQYVERLVKDIQVFISGIKYDDFTVQLPKRFKGQHFDRFYDAFDLLSEKLIVLSQEKAVNQHFLEHLIEHVKVGLLCVDINNDKIVLINPACLKILQRPHISRFSIIKKYSPSVYDAILSLRPGDKKILKIGINNNDQQLSLQIHLIKLANIEYRLLTIHDIKYELETEEILAWQKIIRILTHEIMNSIAPIASISATMNDILNSGETISDKTYETMRQKIAIIHKRSENLMDFAESYRKLRKLPVPVLQQIDLRILIEQITTLLQVKSSEIEWKFLLLSSPLLVYADAKLLEQAFINIIQNAIHAVKNCIQKQIIITLISSKDEAIITIRDTGMGMTQEVKEKVFIPFYTTKTSGSGIGMSIVKQIIVLHKGKIQVISEEEKGTEIRIYLPRE